MGVAHVTHMEHCEDIFACALQRTVVDVCHVVQDSVVHVT